MLDVKAAWAAVFVTTVYMAVAACFFRRARRPRPEGPEVRRNLRRSDNRVGASFACLAIGCVVWCVPTLIWPAGTRSGWTYTAAWAVIFIAVVAALVLFIMGAIAEIAAQRARGRGNDAK